ncbi:hypothetical protein Glove_300g26 [Diversispora epigaea]|uniref:Protein kinase domain-containing protein n=1 Tax=Diversispora epigaea TaxID=1348612 RepID=A0A397I1A9_9GLOM|nr:hypothetical protein Glove_300g26 [Diversispora epigaea]
MENIYYNENETTKDEEEAFQCCLKSAEEGNSEGQFRLGYCYEHGIGTTKDKEKAFQWYLKSAEGGNSNGQDNLGHCYRNGIGTTKDDEKAFMWYLKSAEGGNTEGQSNLGYCYDFGVGITKDQNKAFQWYLKSAEGENISGQYNLASCYRYGIGTTKDEVKAFQWYLKSAEGGNSNGQFHLGDFYYYGIGTPKDDEKAFQWYLKSAEGGNNNGLYSLGYCYDNGIGTTKDEVNAFQWYLKSAESGNIDGQCSLGDCYLNEIGTTKDEDKAFQWYLKSAEGGNIRGQYYLARCYQLEIGTAKDEEKAFQWYLKSAEGGNSYGQYILGVCYENGIGTTKDEKKAFQWCLKSAEGGNNDGQFLLGTYYLGGFGTTKDEEKALQWILKSVEGGNDNGKKIIEMAYRDEFEISTIKKNQNTNGKDSSLASSKSSIENLNIIEGLNIDNDNCCICWKKNGCIEICKRNFQDFGRCHNCGNLNIRKNICKDCKYLELENILYFSIDNDEIVNTIIQITELDENAKEWEIWRWIDYSTLKDIKYLDHGAFGTVWKAEWKDMPEGLFEIYNSNQVALKKLINSKKMSREFSRELLRNFRCRSRFVLPIFGITQDPETMEYAIVLRYMNNGNLRDYLLQNKTLPWTERLFLLESFLAGLDFLHYKGYIHCDLHPGNLMITEAFDNLKFIRLGDLGFCRPVDETKSSKRYGVLPYIAPEILNQNEYTQASDIYSVGIIMWVISTGKIPFSNRAYDLELTLEILDGLRPKIKKGTPQCYAELMKKCWHKDPSERPRIEIIHRILGDWAIELKLNEQAEFSLEFFNADQEIKNELISTETIHSEASLISKPLPLLSPLPQLPPFQYSNFNLSNTDWNELFEQ